MNHRPCIFLAKVCKVCCKLIERAKVFGFTPPDVPQILFSQLLHQTRTWQRFLYFKMHDKSFSTRHKVIANDPCNHHDLDAVVYERFQVIINKYSPTNFREAQLLPWFPYGQKLTLRVCASKEAMAICKYIAR